MLITSPTMQIDETDKKILKMLQHSFPLVARPFRRIAETLVIEETDVLERVEKLKASGVIRRIGAIHNPKKLGFKSTLIGLHANNIKITMITEYLNKQKGITHNYKRDNKYNVWFTFIYKQEAELDELIAKLKANFKIENILNLPAIMQYKLDFSTSLEQ